MNYPFVKKRQEIKLNNSSNRGTGLEDDINKTNEYYLKLDIAVIHKKPTPIKIVKVSFDEKKSGVIKEAYFKEPSTTDYNGIYRGRYIDFEAKEVHQSSFNLSNIHAHQIKHLACISNHGGIGFLIVRFSKLGKTFLLPSEVLLDFVEKNERKSIPLSIFEEQGFLIKDGYQPRLHYLKAVNQFYFGGEDSEKETSTIHKRL